MKKRFLTAAAIVLLLPIACGLEYRAQEKKLDTKTAVMRAIEDAMVVADDEQDTGTLQVLFVLRGAVQRGHQQQLASHCADFARAELIREGTIKE